MRMDPHRRCRRAAATAVLGALAMVATIAALAAPAAAGTRPALGPRAGWTHDGSLDQVHLGGHAVFTEVLPNVRTVPSVELGLGGGATLLAVNGDVFYEVTQLASADWKPRAGAGVALNSTWAGGTSRTQFGLNLLVGLSYNLVPDRRDVFAELRLGVEDGPNLKLTLGLDFF